MSLAQSFFVLISLVRSAWTNGGHRDSYKDVLITAIGGKDILKNITQGISDLLGF